MKLQRNQHDCKINGKMNFMQTKLFIHMHKLVMHQIWCILFWAKMPVYNSQQHMKHFVSIYMC